MKAPSANSDGSIFKFRCFSQTAAARGVKAQHQRCAQPPDRSWDGLIEHLLVDDIVADRLAVEHAQDVLHRDDRPVRGRVQLTMVDGRTIFRHAG